MGNKKGNFWVTKENPKLEVAYKVELSLCYMEVDFDNL